MPFIVAAVVAVATTVGSVIGSVLAVAGSVFSAVGGLFTAGGFLGFVARSALSFGLSKLFAPKAGQAVVAQRQASVVQLAIGEQPRGYAFGRCALGGRLADAFNYGNDFEWEVLVIALCDHEIDALESFVVNDKTYAWSADGLQTHADFMDGGVSHLEIHLRRGTLTQTPPSGLVASSGGRWTSNDVMKGVAHVWVAYKVNEKVWPAGRPSFRWIGRWAKQYDPRKDSTVAGGSGAHRWADPSTWEWSDNAYLAWYNYQRGRWTNGQLLVGPGRGEDEAPAARAIAPTNACDEDVALKAGGTEKRYRASGYVRADETWADVADDFAVAMAGEIVERDGGWEIDVGVTRTIAFSITDADLLANAGSEYQAKAGRADLVNTIAATYISPSKLYEDHSAPLRRSTADIAADGEARERSMALVYVTSDTQAQRVAEIARRKARRMKQASLPLSLRFMKAEVGDWINWTSALHFGGQTISFVVVGVGIDPLRGVSLALREIHSDVYGWTAATDELDALAPAYLPAGAPTAARIADFDADPFAFVGADAMQRPGVRCSFAVPTDQTITSIRFDWRLAGASQIVSLWALPPWTGEHIFGNVPAASDIEVRATPETTPARAALTTAWALVRTVSESAVITGYLTNESHTVATNADGTGGSYAGGGGVFKVQQGLVDKTGAGPAYSIVGGSITGGLAISIDAATGVYTVANLGGDNGRATLRAEFDGVVVDRDYSIAKSKAGGVTPPPVTPVTGYLTRETYEVATAYDGSGGDFTGAGGTFKVAEGETDVTGAGPAYSVVSGSATGGLSISINASTGVYTISGLTSDSGSVTLRAVYASTTLDKTYLITKRRAELKITMSRTTDSRLRTNVTEGWRATSSVFAATVTNNVGALSYAWEQIEGPTMTITAPSASETRFQYDVSPDGNATGRFRLTVTDAGSGLSKTVVVTFTVISTSNF